jgi:hypothetical protein
LYSKMVNRLPEGRIVEIITNGRAREGVCLWRATRGAVLRWPPPPRAWMWVPLQSWEPIRMDGNDQFTGTCWRIREIGWWSWLCGSKLCPWRHFLMGKEQTHIQNAYYIDHTSTTPSLTCVCFRGFTKTNTKHVNRGHNKVQWIFGGGPNAPSP